jgi:hypothetical protein
VTEESCQDLLAAADMFGLTDVLQACCCYLLRQLHPANCIGEMSVLQYHYRICCQGYEIHVFYVKDPVFQGIGTKSIVYL